MIFVFTDKCSEPEIVTVDDGILTVEAHDKQIPATSFSSISSSESVNSAAMKDLNKGRFSKVSFME